MRLVSALYAVAFLAVAGWVLTRPGPAVEPAPERLAQWLRTEDLASRPYDHWSYVRNERVGRRSHLGLVGRIVLAGMPGAGLTGGAVSTLAPGATGSDLTLGANLTFNGGSGGCVGTSGADQICFNPNQMNITATAGINLLNNAVITTMSSTTAMTLNPGTTFAVHGSNFDLTTAGIITIIGDIQLPATFAVYLNGATRTIGFSYDNTNIKVLGAAPLTPASDQGINLGSSSLRWSNGFFGGPIESDVSKGTAASGTGVTANYTSNLRTFVHKVTVTSAAMTASTTTDVTLHTTPANTRIQRVTADVTQVFTGGALTAVTVMCGNSAGGNQYLLANSVFTAQNTWGDNNPGTEIGAALTPATLADMGTSSAGVPGAITVQCRFTCTTANCNAATQGSVTFYVEGTTY